MGLSPAQEKVVASIYEGFEAQMNPMRADVGTLKTRMEQIEAVLQRSGGNGDSAGRRLAELLGVKGGDDGRSFTDWLKATYDCHNAQSQEARNKAFMRLKDLYQTERYDAAKVVRQQLDESTGATGSYLVPEIFRSELLSIGAESAVVRPRATVIPMGAPSLSVPALDVEIAPTTAGTTQFFGGVRAYWTEVGTTKTETEPTFRQIKLAVHELAGYSLIANALLADSVVSLEPLLRMLFGGAISWYEDFAYLQGSGAGEPQGVLNSNALLTTTRTTANQVALADTADMLSKLLPSSMGRAVWIAHISVLDQLVQFADSSNIIWIPNAVEALPMRLHGRPVIFTEKVPQLGNRADLGIYDFAYYLIGDRRDLEINSSEHYAFVDNQTTWRFSMRVDGQPWINNAITLQDTSYQCSPFVRLGLTTD